jgi:hypothetical protein
MYRLIFPGDLIPSPCKELSFDVISNKTRAICHGKYSPCQGVRDPLSVLIYRGFLPINLQLTRASKTAIPLRDTIFWRVLTVYVNILCD